MVEESNLAVAAKIAHIPDSDRPIKVILNVGSDDGVSKGDLYLVYALGEEIFDPDSGESLGQIEILKGRGKVTHVQRKMCTLESTSTRTIRRKMNSLLSSLYGSEEDETITISFDEPVVGDLATKLG